MYVLYFQGRAWSIQFEDSNQLDTFLENLLNLRLDILKKNCTSFLQNKGKSEVTLNADSNVQIKVENSKNMTILLQPNKIEWHQILVGLKEDAEIMLFCKNSETFKDILQSEDSEAKTLKLQLKGIVNEEQVPEPKKDMEKYINKVGRAVIPTQQENTKDQSDAMESKNLGKR